MSSTLDQKVLFFDHILGLRDKLVQGPNGLTKAPAPPGGDTGNVQKRTYRYSPAIARANISGPVPEDDFKNIIDLAVSGREFDLDLVFYRRDAPHVHIGKAIVSSLTIDIKAGDVAQFSMEVVGAEYVFLTGASSPANCTKLVTWDQCIVEATPIAYDMASFSVSINNPPIPIYTSKWTTDEESNGMMPQKIRIGMQEVTGTIGVYGPVPINVPSLGTVKFDLNGVSKTIQAVFIQPKDEASTGPYIRSVTFAGVNEGSIWV